MVPFGERHPEGVARPHFRSTDHNVYHAREEAEGTVFLHHLCQQARLEAVDLVTRIAKVGGLSVHSLTYAQLT